MGKGLNVPANLEKAYAPPQKRIERNKWESSIHLLLMTFPVCSHTSLCLVGIPEDVPSCAWYNVVRRI